MSSHSSVASNCVSTSARRIYERVHHRTLSSQSFTSAVLPPLRPIRRRPIVQTTTHISYSQARRYSSLTSRTTRTRTTTTSTSTQIMSAPDPPQNAHHRQRPPKEKDRSYQSALHRLAQLQSNKTITNLFSAPSPSSDPTDPKPRPSTTDLNALAMPEMLAWLARAGYTPSSLAASGLRCVHVAGTKGKGSVSALVASILTQYTSSTCDSSKTSQKIGLYTSPHVLSVRERIQINGSPLGQEKFAGYFFELWDALSEAARRAGDLGPLSSSGSIQAHTTSESERASAGVADEEEDPYDGPATKPFYFRFLTLLALHVFVREGVTSAVVECGIGGEYDPTNVLTADMVTAAVITQLGIDHVSMLGDTVPEIAWHKAGILKSGVRGFTRALSQGDEGEEVMAVLRRRAEEKGAVLEEVDDGEVEAWWKGFVREGEGEKEDEARLQGPFQRYNMALAAKAAREHLLRMSVEIGEGEFARTGRLDSGDLPGKFVRGLKNASLRGRCEVFSEKEAEWLVDGAHTEDSLRGVGEWFAGRVKKKSVEDGGGGDVRVLLFNQQDRDPAVLLKALLAGARDEYGDEHNEPLFTHAIFTRNEENSPVKGEEEARDLDVQERAQEVFRAFVGESKVQTWTQNAVVPSIELIRDLARKAKEEGKTCKVLTTGSFHLVGAVLKTIDHVEYKV